MRRFPDGKFLTYVVTVALAIGYTSGDETNEYAEILKKFAEAGGNTAGIDLAHIMSYVNQTKAPGRPIGRDKIGFGLREKEKWPSVTTRPRPSRILRRQSPTTKEPEPESVVGPVPARFKPKPTCHLKATDIIVIVDNNASKSAIVERDTFQFLRNLFGKMDIRPNGVRVALETGGRQANRRLTLSQCLDVQCVYAFLHSLVRDSDRQNIRPERQAGVNSQPIVYSPLEAVKDAYLYNRMTMFGNRTKVLLFLTYGKTQGTTDELKLIWDTFDILEGIKRVAMFLPMDKGQQFGYNKMFKPVWRPRVSNLRLMTEADYWTDRLCQFLKTGVDKVAVTPEPSTHQCTFTDVSRGCRMNFMTCSELIDRIPDDPQHCSVPPPIEEVCPDVQECMHNCDVNATPWTSWACFVACEDPDEEQEPRRYRNRQMLVGAEPMACQLFQTENGCLGMLPPCPSSHQRLRNVPPPKFTDRDAQEIDACGYSTSKICRYTHPGICNGVEERRASSHSTDCPTSKIQVECDAQECDEECDELTTPWSEWSACPECVPPEQARPPISTRGRKLKYEEEIYCAITQGRVCVDLRVCGDSGKSGQRDLNAGLELPNSEMQQEAQASPEERRRRQPAATPHTTLVVTIIVVLALIAAVVVGFAVAVYFVRQLNEPVVYME